MRLLNSRTAATALTGLPKTSAPASSSLGRQPNVRQTPYVVSRSSSSSQQTTAAGADAASPSPAQSRPTSPQFATEEERFQAAYAQAWTMSQLFVQDRPEAVPLEEWETRRKKRDMEEILAAAKKRGKDTAAVQSNLEALENLLPNFINLFKMKPADYVTLSEDVNGAASKLISLKAEFPKADIFSIMAARPKTLLQSEATLLENARKVKSLLAAAQDVDAIIQAVPELSDPTALSRSLAFLKSTFPSQDPVLLLQENPQILLNLVESNMEDSAEYGEMTTKD